jgi:HlyD family secretion protein
MARQKQDSAGVRLRGSLWTVLGAIVLAVIVLAAFMSRNKDIPVRAGKATLDTITASISTNGKIEPINGFEAHAPLPTTVRRVFVHEGEQVRAGQPLLELDDANALAQAARATSQLRAAQADLNAVRSGGTREEVITNKSALTRARAELQSAQRNLEALKSLQQSGAASPGEVLDAESRLKTAQAQVNLEEQKLSSRYSRPEVAKVHPARGSVAGASPRVSTGSSTRSGRGSVCPREYRASRKRLASTAISRV